MEAWNYDDHQGAGSMAGNERLDASVTPGDAEVWIRESIQLLRTGETFRSAHLDEIGLRWNTWASAMKSLRQVAAELPPSWSGRLSLALPLEESAHLLTAVPTALESLSSKMEPPSIYLLSPAYFAVHFNDGDEYRSRVISFGADEEWPAEFVSRREMGAAKAGCEYTNTVWVHANLAEKPSHT